MLSPLPRRSSWAYCFAHSPSRISLPRKGCRVGLRIVLFEACSAFTRVTACTLALSPIRDTHSEGFSYFVTSIAAPAASGWSGRRVGLAPTGKRRLLTAHTHSGHSSRFPTALQNAPDSAPDVVVWAAAELARGRHEETRVHHAHRRRGGLAGGGARAAVGGANHRLPRQRIACGIRGPRSRLPPGPGRNRPCRGPERSDRIPLGGGPI